MGSEAAVKVELKPEQTEEFVPDQVKRQAEEAQKLQESIGKPAPEESEKETPSKPEPETPAKKEEPKKEDPKKEGKTDEERIAYLERRLSTVTGMLEAQGPRHAEETRELKERIAGLEKENADLKAGKAEKPAEEKKEAPALQKIDPEEWDDDPAVQGLVNQVNGLIDVIQSIQSAPKTSEEFNSIKSKVENHDRVIAKTAAEKYEDALNTKAPGWEKLNNDDGFNDWLDETDPFTQLPRRTLLEDAHGKMEADRVAAFFNAYSKQGAPKKEPEPGRERTLESEIEPETDVAPETTPGERKAATVTKAQFQQAVQDFQTGRMTEEKFNEIANEYQRAIKEGRPLE